MVVGRMGKAESIKNAVVHVSVYLGEPNEIGEFRLAVVIKVERVLDDVFKADHEVSYDLLSDINNNFHILCFRRAPTAAPYNRGAIV